MAGCASCLHKNVHPNVCSDCLGGTHFKPRNKTKADLIRSMTDEELADELLEWFACFCAVEWTREQILDYLKQEVV